MSGKTLEDIDRSKCPSTQFSDQILNRIAQTLVTGNMFCNFRGECKRKPDGKNCMDPTPEEAIEIVEIIITFARLVDMLRGAVVLQFCSGKQSCCLSWRREWNHWASESSFWMRTCFTCLFTGTSTHVSSSRKTSSSTWFTRTFTSCICCWWKLWISSKQWVFWIWWSHSPRCWSGLNL